MDVKEPADSAGTGVSSPSGAMSPPGVLPVGGNKSPLVGNRSPLAVHAPADRTETKRTTRAAPASQAVDPMDGPASSKASTKHGTSDQGTSNMAQSSAPPGRVGGSPISARRPGSRGAMGLIRGMAAARKREKHEAVAKAELDAREQQPNPLQEDAEAGKVGRPPRAPTNAASGGTFREHGERKVAPSSARLAMANAKAAAAASDVRE